jgi:hypothetical protein
MDTWQVFFGWPGGGVWSNLLASAICVGVAWWRLRAKMIAHHAAQMAQAARHHKEQLTQADVHHKERLASAAAHCADLKEHVETVAESQGRGGSTPFDSRERLDGPPATVVVEPMDAPVAAAVRKQARRRRTTPAGDLP